MMREIIKKYKRIEKEFFDIDDEKKIAYIKLEFEKPSDIFEKSAVTKTPMINDDFIDWLVKSFSFVPNKYKLDLNITFDDFEEYSEEELMDICKKNILHEMKIRQHEMHNHNMLALSLCGVGLVCILISILTGTLWTDGGVVRDIVLFVLDILATVPFWAAADIFFVENGGMRRNATNLKKRFHAIAFHKKEK